jgi:HK97 family phage prohead protease
LETRTAVVYKSAPVQRAESDDELVIVASDESPDRLGDVIKVDGWELGAYRKNPVVLWQHKAGEPPIGRAERVWTHAKQLLARIRLAPEGTSAVVDTLRKLLAADMVRAASVGFRPIKEPTPIRDREERLVGFEFDGTELLEISLVNVPAQAAALRKCLELGISQEHLDLVTATPALGFLARRRAELDLTTARRRGHPLEMNRGIK